MTTESRAAMTETVAHDDELRQHAEQISKLMVAAYDDWIGDIPGLNHPIAQGALFAVMCKRLAEIGVPMGDMIRTVCRAHGFEAHDISVSEPPISKV